MSKKVTMKAKKVSKVVTKKGAKKIVSPKLIAKKVAAAKKAVSKVIKKQVVTKKKVVAKKVVKKPVAKKKVTKEAIKAKYQKLYKIVSKYSDNLMQDVYSVVYRTKELKRFINENLANTYIEQEVLHKMAEHAINTAKKSRAVSKELASEFE
jgi:hypothetical protein